ncbi:MAG: exodeoxyribonuclease I [Pseudomonadota bacterium]
MNKTSFFWHDYETFGRDPRQDRPAQFAGVRTDLELQEIAEPVMAYCQPAPDHLPDPESCLLTGITPQVCAAQGLAEHAFAEVVHAELSREGTVGVGYNSIKFDDEVTRFLLWRCLLDPYAREWQNQCGRWDLLNVVRCAFAFRPETLEWPRHPDGRPSLKLEHLCRANGVVHDQAHDALSDVRATLALGRLIKQRSPRLWEFCLGLRDKHKVMAEMSTGGPFWHVSGMYGADRGCLAMVWPLAPHPFHKNEVIVWDLSQDPGLLQGLPPLQIRERLFTPRDQWPSGLERLPIKTIHINQSPVVVGQLKTLTPALAQRWGVDVDQCLRHAERLAAAQNDTSLWRAVFERPNLATRDVDQDLYGGLITSQDRRTLERLRQEAPRRAVQASFEDERLDELLFRYRARNFPQTLSGEERARWRLHCIAVLGPKEAYLSRLELARGTSEASTGTKLVDALAAHAELLFAAAGS